MGLSQSTGDFEVDYNKPAAWTLDHVKELAQVWKDVLNMNFGLKKDQVAALFAKCSFSAGKDFEPLVSECWRRFNPDNQALVDALGLICTFAIVSRAEFTEKIDFVFKLFDFNGNGAISKDELTILVMASLLGMVRFFMPTKPIPSDAACEAFSDRAFREIDADTGGSIALDEFRSFVKTQLDKDGSGSISAQEFLGYFGVQGDTAKDAARGGRRVADPARHDSSDDERKAGSEEDFYDSDIDRDQPSHTQTRPNVAEPESLFDVDDADTGDQFMAVKPWIGAIKAPTAPPKAVNARPDADLSLEWVHGYRAFDTRSNVRVLANGEYVWHTAAVGIVYNKEKHAQKQFFGHNDDIVSLAAHPNGAIVATGQMGKRPVIHVWDATKPEGEQAIIALKAKTLTRACTQLAFSPDGRQLAAIGLDDDHTLHVFLDWASGAEAGVAVVETDKAKILDLAFGDGGKLMTVGVDHVGVWTVNGRKIEKKKGLFGSQKLQAILSVAYFQGKFVTGSVSGRLWSWNGHEVETVLKEAHTSSINSMYAQGDMLLSGGKDGKVVLWNKTLTKAGMIDISTAPGLASAKDANVRSVACGDGAKNIVVGAMSGDILHYASPTVAATVIHESHFYGELWGLAMHPSNDTYATAGDDATIRVWNRATRRCVVRKTFDTYIRCLTFSPDGKFIACGTGGRLGGLIPKTNGALYVLNASTLEIVHQGQDSKRWNQDIKWSPDGRTIALGCHDQVVHLYDATNGYKEKGVCKGHSSYITHIDFTADSKFLHTNCGAYELLFWDAETGAQETWGATNLKDAEWASWTAVLGWPVQGIWPPASDGTDINSVDRSHSGKMLVTVDDFGKVKLFNFPNTAPGWMSAEFEGHSSHVTNGRWSHDDRHIVTIGGNDKSVFQWRVEVSAGDDDAEALDEVADEADEEVSKVGAMAARAAAKKAAAPPKPAADMFAMDDEGTGDQFMAVKPWIGAIKAPSRPPKIDNTAPAIDMDLQWVYGYQAQAMRNSLRATASGKLVYTVAAVGVVYDPVAHKQAHFRGHHTDDIISFAQSADGKLVATGEQGKRPVVYVWNPDTCEVEWELKGHKRGVPQLAFSNNGKMLATVGLDDDHTIIVYDLGTGEVLCKQKGDTQQIMSVAWQSNDAAFITTGVKHICFWEPSVRGLACKKGILGTKGKQQTHMVSAFDSAGNAVVGNNDGSLYVFAPDRNLKSVVAAGHTGAVYAMWFDGANLFTGGKDNLVKKWAPACASSVQEWTFGGAVRSIHTAKGKMLVGTIFSEIIEVTGAEQKVLAEAHYFGELWGLATHPSKDHFVSSGDDGTLRVWDAIGHQQVAKTSLATLARAAVYSPDGSKIAVALGGRLGGKEDGPEGQWHVLDAATLAIEHTGNDAKAWCQDIKWSPDGRTIALGSHDTKVYLYDAAGGYKLKGICKGHSSYITHIDFTADSRFLHTNCGAYELLFWDANTGAQDPSGATNLKDAEWASWTAVLGWPVQGIWPPLADGTDINNVDRNHEGNILASADDFGKVKLFRYPVVNVGAGFSQLDGHSSHVTSVRFTHDDCYVISAGGNDRALFQWDNTANEPDSIEFEDKDIENEGFVPPRTAAHEAARSGLFFEVEGEAAGDQFMAVKPWIGAIKGPTAPPVVPNDPPLADLELEWVHGYRSFDTRSNAYYLSSGEVVYHTAAVGIVFNKKTWTQRFFRGHTDDIVSLAVHPNGTTVATGQMGKDPSIFVWDSSTLSVIKEIKGFHKRAVFVLKFSELGDLLLSIGQDDDHSLGVYDWKSTSSARPRRGEAPAGLKTAKVHQDKVLDAAFNADGTEICVVGVKVIKVFNANTLSGGAVTMGDVGKLQPFMSVVYFGGFAVVGTATGSLYLVKDKKVTREVAAHGSTVNSMHVGNDGMLLTGAKDGEVKIWNTKFEVTHTFSLKGTKSVLPNVRSIAKHDTEPLYLVGTMGAEVYELKNDGSCPAGEPFTEGHYYGELWGLATHPSTNAYLTAGDDGWVRVWDVARRRCVAKTSVGTLARAACFSPDGRKIAVCLGGRLGGKEEGAEGEWRVLDAATLAVEHKASDPKSWCQDIKYSPDGATLAIGSHDDKVYLYDVAGGYSLKGICKGHSSYITHIDFTADSKFLHTNCGAYELLFWDANTGKQDPSGATKLRDAEWASWTAVLGWPVQGIWPPASDGTDINTVDRSHSGQVLVSADDFGLVKLFTFPNTAAGWDFKKYGGHSSHVTNVRFTHDDSYVVSAGGNDKAIFQWKTSGMESAMPPVEAAPSDTIGATPMFDMFATEDAGGGDQFMAVKPWIGAIKAPTAPPADNPAAPAVSMKLEWVHGYQAQLTRNSLVYVQDPVAAASGKGDICYAGAAVTVVYDSDKHTQRHHRNTPKTPGCTDDIISLAVSCDGKSVAVGERGKRPVIAVVDTTTMATVASLKGHRNGVAQLAFSNGGALLASVGLDDNHTVIVYEWKTGTVAFTAKGDTNQIMGVSWAPDDSYFVTVGVNHIYFWEAKGRTYNKTRGILGDTALMTTFLNCGFSDSGKAVIASAEGDLLRFSGDWTYKSSIKAHEGAISAMWQGSGELVTGGADGKIKFWNTKTFDVTKEYSLAAGIRSVCTEPGQPLLVGTVESEVWQIAGDGRQTKLFESHYAAWHHMGELWGCAPHPKKQRFASCGDDRTVRTWDVVARKELRKASFEGLMRAIAYSPDGRHLAVAFGGRLGGKEDGLCGAYKVLDAETLEVVAAGQDSDAWVQEIKYSPDGATLAIGSHDDKVYLYDVAGGYKKKAICKGHSSYITHIDFTADSRFLHTNCGAYELLFWDANTGKQDPSGATNLRDAEWASWTAVLGWPVQGIWPPLADGTDINATDRSHSGMLLATADDYGTVKMFNYPVVKTGAASAVFTGHTSHVTNVRFLFDDKTVITVGGNDRCLFQWKL